MLSGVVPFDMGVLPEIGDVFVCNVAVGKKVGKVSMLRAVLSVQLFSVELQPNENLLLW